jgi:hypothetical protein
MLFSPIQLYGSNWPDALADTSAPGFGRHFGKGPMGTNPKAIAAQVNYLKQILNHVNPYTGVALKNEPAILFIELVNEPWHHPEDIPGSIRYIDALTDAVRSTGCDKLIFYNVSQDFRIGEAIRRSRVQGVTFGWYPTGLNSGHELSGNYLRSTDAFPAMLRPELARLPRIVYEFDSPDLRNATMYPAMVRTFRSVGTQFAAMFAYDMLRTASRNLGWQTHYLNLVYTPRKAVSAVIAAEAMRRLPRMRGYGEYPANLRFGEFRLAPDSNLAELVAPDALIHAGSTGTRPPDPKSLQRVVGYGSSPIVSYQGEGAYFLDRLRPGVWRLEVYPDAVPVRDPFEPPSLDKIVTRAIGRAWPMTVSLPDLGTGFTAQPIAGGKERTERAADGRFMVEPGVYLLSGSGPVDLSTLPRFVGSIGLAEYHGPPPDTSPPVVTSLAGRESLTGRDMELVARVVETSPPDSVRLFVRPSAGTFHSALPMRPAGGYLYAATIPAASLGPGPYQYAITLFHGDSSLTFPGGLRQKPTDWDYHGAELGSLNLVSPVTPLTLFDPLTDASRLAFTRIGDAGRRGLFRLATSESTGGPIFHFELPVDEKGWSPADYTASLVIQDRIAARRETITGASGLRIRARGLGPREIVYLTLMESDGTSWTAAAPIGRAWSELSVPLSSFRAGRGVLLPQGFPGEWAYWVGPASARGGSGDRPHLERIERLQISLRRETKVAVRTGTHGVELEWVRLEFAQRSEP